MSDILTTILEHKRTEVDVRRAKRPLAELLTACRSAPPVRGFVSALRSTFGNGTPGVIAEIKRASPSKGLIRADFDPPAIASSYAAGGATCLSVLTDEKFFQGADGFLVAARSAVRLPVIRKDFIVDRYQIAESRCLGADCILLIASALSRSELREFYSEGRELGLDALIEVHDEDELRTALELSPTLIGVNNRNLKTFEVSLQTTVRLRSLLPEGILMVAESGIHTRDDVALLQRAGVNTFLVGEAFMRAAEPGQKLRELFF
jgi:indole-3-glycerol phosphate synthase